MPPVSWCKEKEKCIEHRIVSYRREWGRVYAQDRTVLGISLRIEPYVLLRTESYRHSGPTLLGTYRLGSAYARPKNPTW